ncbi:hypothetical protein HID58_050564 [Brassica napus]|uniref:Uncharacterized protein n=1 Tax=Brassica napus TaxID=3708 RepID=A0ABQ8A6H4_BRANA|nr:hypothetical protein HID58_050564 [Brassica napus]
MEGYQNGSSYAPFLSLTSHQNLAKSEFHQGEEEASKVHICRMQCKETSAKINVGPRSCSHNLRRSALACHRKIYRKFRAYPHPNANLLFF